MWEEKDDALHAEFKFDNFRKAFAFMTEVAFVAEEANHHPEWSNVYNKVTIKLTTHDAGNKITDKDRQMSEQINKLYSSKG